MCKSLIILLAVCLLAAAVVLAAPATDESSTGVERKLGFDNLVCDACKAVVDQVKTNMAQFRPQIDQLCNYCGSPEADEKCRNKLHELEDKIEHEKSHDLCAMVGFCRPKPPSDPKTFYDFSGQF